MNDLKNKIKTICEVNLNGGVSYFDEVSAKYFVDPHKYRLLDNLNQLNVHEFSFIEVRSSNPLK